MRHSTILHLTSNASQCSTVHVKLTTDMETRNSVRECSNTPCRDDKVTVVFLALTVFGMGKQVKSC